MSFAVPAPFLSAAAAGSDWREAARRVAEALQKDEAVLKACTVGFLYVTDALGAETRNILAFLREVTGIAAWVGAGGIGVIGTQGGVMQSFVDKPAIAVMAGAFDAGHCALIPQVDGDPAPVMAGLASWLEEHEPMLVLLHGDPLADVDPALTLAELAQEVGGFTAGGLASARGARIHIAGDVMEGGGLSGVAFAQEVEIATALSQGCAPLGASHRVTRCEDNVIMELDDQPAFDILAGEVQALAATADPSVVPDGDGGVTIRGEVHIGFPVPGRDHTDYLVRHALGIDPERGWIAVGHPVQDGTPLLFVHRDEHTVRADLARVLVDLRKRVSRQCGQFAPRGAVYISCVARAGLAGGPDEMKLVQDVLGDIPLAGFYANGEIANGHIYGYTAVVILFL